MSHCLEVSSPILPPPVPNLAQTVQRVIPPFKISYSLSTEMGENDIDDGDYAELAETTELYLTVYFSEYFAIEPADFHEVNVIVQQTDDPLTIRFFVSASFVVPGKSLSCHHPCALSLLLKLFCTCRRRSNYADHV
jgi:hypothetical protein